MKYVGLIFALFSVTSAFAVQNENVTIIKKSPDTIYSGSSEHHRMGKSFQILLEPFGQTPSGLAGGGLSAGYFIDRKSMITVDATSSAGNPYYSSSIATYKIASSTVGVHYKRFFGNSFYVRSGLDFRHVDYKYNYHGYMSILEPTDGSFVGDSTAASLVIGNQWQWENFTLGCDWIGITAPITSEVTETISENSDQYERDRQERHKQQLVANTIGQGLRFYLGASF